MITTTIKIMILVMTVKKIIIIMERINVTTKTMKGKNLKIKLTTIIKQTEEAIHNKYIAEIYIRIYHS